MGFKKILPAFIWFLLTVVLLSLPASSLPSRIWMSKIQLDKWIHTFIFFVLTILLCLPLWYKTKSTAKPVCFNQYTIFATLLSIIVGVIMEYIQKYCIPNRSFEILDIVADSAGSILGFLFCFWQYKKSPNRHRGRY